MGKAVAVTPAQVKAAQMRVARMRERGETPPEKLEKIANARSRAKHVEETVESEETVDGLREQMRSAVENSIEFPQDWLIHRQDRLLEPLKDITLETLILKPGDSTRSLFPAYGSQAVELVSDLVLLNAAEIAKAAEAQATRIALGHSLANEGSIDRQTAARVREAEYLAIKRYREAKSWTLREGKKQILIRLAQPEEATNEATD